MQMRRTNWMWGMAGCLMAVGAHEARAEQTISGSHTLAADGNVRIETISGTVTVRAQDEGGVSVSGTMGDDLKLEISGTDHNVLVKVKWPEGRHRHRGSSNDDCRLEVAMPKGASLETETVSASVDISGINGTMEVQTVSGDVHVLGDPSKLGVEVVSGDIALDVGSQRVKLEAVSGTVQARTGGGEFEASTVSGDIDLQGESFSSINIESVSGDVSFTAALEPKGQVEINSHSGDVDAGFRGSLSAQFDVSTFSGSIESELGGEAARTSKYAPGSEYERTIGDGSGRVSIDAFSGTVKLRKV
jgi:DUF4097 and DUF4098 domain-containing protein YvlB